MLNTVCRVITLMFKGLKKISPIQMRIKQAVGKRKDGLLCKLHSILTYRTFMLILIYS